MPSARDRRRLKRLSAPLVRERWDAERRNALRARVGYGAVISETLAGNGIDPAPTYAERYAREAEAELAAIPDTPELQHADAECTGHLAKPGDAIVAMIPEQEALAKRYAEDGLDIDLASASMPQVFAWCMAQGWIEITPRADGELLLIQHFTEDSAVDDAAEEQ